MLRSLTAAVPHICLSVHDVPHCTVQGGDLYSALRHHSETMKWERLGRKVALDVALGLNYLHAQVGGCGCVFVGGPWREGCRRTSVNQVAEGPVKLVVCMEAQSSATTLCNNQHNQKRIGAGAPPLC